MQDLSQMEPNKQQYSRCNGFLSCFDLWRVLSHWNGNNKAFIRLAQDKPKTHIQNVECGFLVSL